MHLMVDRLRIGQVPVDVVSFAQALDAVEALVAAKQGGFVFTPNIDHVVVADAQPAFAQAYQRAALCLADGMPLVWASRLLGRPLPGRVAGSDLIVPLLERAGQRGWRVFFFGAGPGVAQKAAEPAVSRVVSPVLLHRARTGSSRSRLTTPSPSGWRWTALQEKRAWAASRPDGQRAHDEFRTYGISRPTLPELFLHGGHPVPMV